MHPCAMQRQSSCTAADSLAIKIRWLPSFYDQQLLQDLQRYSPGILHAPAQRQCYADVEHNTCDTARLILVRYCLTVLCLPS